MWTDPSPHRAATPPLTRRALLTSTCQGAGALALAGLLGDDRAFAGAASLDPLAARRPHFAPRATRCIFIFMSGGVSQVDTFDYKHELATRPGQPVPRTPGVEGEVATFLKAQTQILPPVYPFKRFGQMGRNVCGLFEHLGPVLDNVAFIHGVRVDANNHAPATMHIATGSIFQGHPSVGAWVGYGLGTENRDLPGYMVLHDPRGLPTNGPAVWSSGFLPATYQGTPLRPAGPPILDLDPPAGITTRRARRSLDLLSALNRHHAQSRAATDDLDARIASYELAFRMQSQAPDLVDLSGESGPTRESYGLDKEPTAAFGRQCLLARRLVERGVRFVTVIHGVENNENTSWDHHGNLRAGLKARIAEVDRPIAALLIDLKQRGLLEETLVVFTTEMGRTPFGQIDFAGVKSVTDGRDHNQYALVSWLAGAGVKPGADVGETDPFGLMGIGEPLHVRDLHATILHLMGLNDKTLTYLHEGRHQRLTDTGGKVLRALMS